MNSESSPRVEEGSTGTERDSLQVEDLMNGSNIPDIDFEGEGQSTRRWQSMKDGSLFRMEYEDRFRVASLRSCTTNKNGIN